MRNRIAYPFEKITYRIALSQSSAREKSRCRQAQDDPPKKMSHDEWPLCTTQCTFQYLRIHQTR
jgi:hypothetical protein